VCLIFRAHVIVIWCVFISLVDMLCAIDRRLYFPKVNTKKMSSQIITQVFGGHGGKTSSGATNAASRQSETVIARALLESRLQKRQASS